MKNSPEIGSLYKTQDKKVYYLLLISINHGSKYPYKFLFMNNGYINIYTLKEIEEYKWIKIS